MIIKVSKKQFLVADKENIALGYVTNSDLSDVEYTLLNYYNYNVDNNLLIITSDKSYYEHILLVEDGYNRYYYLVDYVYKQDENIIINTAKIITSYNYNYEQEYLISIDSFSPFQSEEDIENCSFDCEVEEYQENEDDETIYIGEYIQENNPNDSNFIQSQKYSNNLYSTIALAPNNKKDKIPFKIHDINNKVVYIHNYYYKDKPTTIIENNTLKATVNEWLSLENDTVTQYYVLPGPLDLSNFKLFHYTKKYTINNVVYPFNVNKIEITINTYFYITFPRISNILEYNYNKLLTDIYNNNIYITKNTKLFFDIYKGLIIYANDKYQKTIETMKTTVFLEKSGLENFIDKNGQTIGSVLGLVGSTAALIGGIVTANPMPIISGISGIANSSVNIAKNVINSQHYKDYAYKINEAAGAGYLDTKTYSNYIIKCYTKSTYRQNNYYLIKKSDEIFLAMEDITILLGKGLYKHIKIIGDSHV